MQIARRTRGHNDEKKGRALLIAVALLSLTGGALGALGTAYSLKSKYNRPEPGFTLTVSTNATTLKIVDEQGETLGEISDWTDDPIVVRIQRLQLARQDVPGLQSNR